jgi:hypothetical protein
MTHHIRLLVRNAISEKAPPFVPVFCDHRRRCHRAEQGQRQQLNDRDKALMLQDY